MKINLLWLLVILSLVGGVAYAQDAGEAAKIRYLIGSIETLRGVTFIRNGSEYDAKKAARPLAPQAKNGREQCKDR